MGNKKGKRPKKGEAFAFENTSLPLSDPAFAAWFGGNPPGSELVTPYTVMGLSAVIRSVWIISTTIAGLPLRTYERHDDGERTRIPSVFDDPYPGLDGQTPFAWVETILIHLLLWRDAFLWHEHADENGFVDVYRPLPPETVTKVERVNGRMQYTYKDSDHVEHVVGTELITHIPGPSMDTARGHPFLQWARAVFSSAIAGDKAAQTTLSMGIRLAGLVTPADKDEPIDDEEGQSILTQLRAQILGNDHAGDLAFVNRRLKLDPWAPTNVESQHHETAMAVLGDMERLFGVPPTLLADTEKSTSWGTGIAEQNLAFTRFTLTGWSTRMEQVFARTLPSGQFVEFDYHGLLQGTPDQEDASIVLQVNAGILTRDEARRIKNLPPLTSAQKREQGLVPTVPMPPQGAPV